IDIRKIVDSREEVEKGLLKRMGKEDFNLDEILSLYEEKKKVQLDFDTKRAQQNQYNDQMAKEDKGSENFKKLLEELKEKAKEVKESEERLKELEKQLTSKLEVLPNIPDDDVVAGGKEANEVVKMVGEK